MDEDAGKILAEIADNMESMRSDLVLQTVIQTR